MSALDVIAEDGKIQIAKQSAPAAIASAIACSALPAMTGFASS